MPAKPPLSGQVAVVAGATRGAGRGIARGLGEAGAIVYCTGRSVPGNPSPYNRPETIDETAAMVTAAGGTAVAVRVDHTVEAEVEAFFARVAREHGRLDVLVNSIAGEDPILGGWGTFWKTESRSRYGRPAADAPLASHYRQARGPHHDPTAPGTHRRGHRRRYGVWRRRQRAVGPGEMFAQGLRGADGRRAALAPRDGRLPHARVPALRIDAPALWRDGSHLARRRQEGPELLESESPLFVGRAVAALAADPRVLDRSGDILSSWELLRDYAFTDYDGRRPDWGVHFGTILPAVHFVEPIRRHRDFLGRMTCRLDQYLEAADRTAAAEKRSPKADGKEKPAGKASRRK